MLTSMIKPGLDDIAKPRRPGMKEAHQARDSFATQARQIFSGPHVIS